MREIKFRAWSKEWGMVYSNYAIVDPDLFIAKFGTDGDGFWCHPETHVWLTYFIRTDYKFLMQYTGRKDYENKEIYVGDLLEGFNKSDDWEKTHILEVVETKNGFGIRYIDKGEEIIEDFSDELFNDFDIQIDGNIYETPELIKENP